MAIVVLATINVGSAQAKGKIVRPAPTTTTTTVAPTTGIVCNIAPSQGETAIMAAISACPNGSPGNRTIIRFPAGASYRQARKIQVQDRRHIDIDGNGSTFTTTSNGTVTKAIDGNFVILRGFDIRVRNLTVRGDFTAYEGQPRSLGTIGVGDPEFTEAQMGIGLYGVDTVYVEDVKAFNNWGDGLTTGPDEYVDGSTRDYTQNVYVKRMEVETVGRMCWGPTSGNNIWIEDSICRDAWYGGLDAEADSVEQPLRGHHYLRNTFDGFNHFGILIPVLTDNSGDYEIRDNRFLTANDVPSYPVILVGMYPSNPRVATGVNVTGNSVKSYCNGIVFDHVQGGTIQNNTLTRVYKSLPDGSGTYTPTGICGAGYTDPIKVTNSTNVVVGPNALH